MAKLGLASFTAAANKAYRITSNIVLNPHRPPYHNLHSAKKSEHGLLQHQLQYVLLRAPHVRCQGLTA
jgi:hypothetical protein